MTSSTSSSTCGCRRMNGLPRSPVKENRKHLINYKEVIRTDNSNLYFCKHDPPPLQSKEKRL